MKKIFIICLLLLSFLFIKIPKYVELNHIHIIKEIQIKCDQGYYEVFLKEIIPVKEDSGVKYQYKTYLEQGSSINKIKEKIDHHYYFYKDADIIIKHCHHEERLKNQFK